MVAQRVGLECECDISLEESGDTFAAVNRVCILGAERGVPWGVPYVKQLSEFVSFNLSQCVPGCCMGRPLRDVTDWPILGM